MVRQLLIASLLWLVCCGCGSDWIASQAAERLFLPLSLDFLGEYQLPKQTLADMPVGGLSGLTYDRNRDRFYAISDDRKNPRFYTLKLEIDPDSPPARLQAVTVEAVTLLKDAQGNPYPPHTVDGEGIAFTPRETLFVASEGDNRRQILPFIGEFEPATGHLRDYLPLPQRFLPEGNKPTQGIQNNLGFEALAVAATSTLKDDPFRLFTAVENSLIQDRHPEKVSKNPPLRFLHYVINAIGEPVLVGENLYVLDPMPAGTVSQGLSDIATLDREGYFISLERDFGLGGFGAKLFQVINANATDTSQVSSFQDGTTGLIPLKKQLLLDLSTLKIDLDNLEGLAFGPHLADGSPTLLLVSDDNFREEQITQFLLFRVNRHSVRATNLGEPV